MPTFIISLLPEAEQDAARSIQRCLWQLSSSAFEFEAAIELSLQSRNWCDDKYPNHTNKVIKMWPFAGARLGALCLYDFFQATQAINARLLYRCPMIKNHVDHEKKSRAQKDFEAIFGDVSSIRHAAAHPAEINATPEKANKKYVKTSEFKLNTLRGDGYTNMSAGLLDGRYVYSFEGRAASYAVSVESTKALNAVLSLWRDAFLPVEREFSRMLRDD